MINPDIKLAYDAITAKQEAHNNAFRYYDGDHPLVYANERLRNVFAGVQIKFIENWCGVVIDSVLERIRLSGFTVPEGDQDSFQRIWDENKLELESNDLHEAALVTGEAYLIVWPDDNGQLQMFYNDPRLCQMFYDGYNPRMRRMGAKMWVEADDHYRLTLYYPERIEYYRSTQKAESVSSANGFVAYTDDHENGIAPNPFGEVPVFHFRLSRRKTTGDLVDVIPVQNGINKLLTDMMVAAEYGAFKQRYIISNADTTLLKNAPNEIWNIPAGDGLGQSTGVGEFSSTDLGNYLKAIEQLASDIAKTTRTPKHYMYSQGGDPSGEALIALEAPLNRKVAKRIGRLSPTWTEAMLFALRVSGKTVNQKNIIPNFDIVETVQPRTRAEIRMMDIQAGIPLATVLRREGWSEQELVDLDTDKADEDAKSSQLGEQILSKFEKGQ